MDIGRRAYDAECRFWKNAPDTATIRWYEADNLAETLGQDTAIGMGDRESPNYVEYPVGEVAIQNRQFGNLCVGKGPGTLDVMDSESLREGGILDRSLTPQEYQPNGIACSCLRPDQKLWRNGAPYFGHGALLSCDTISKVCLQVPCVKGLIVRNVEIVGVFGFGAPFPVTVPFQLEFGTVPYGSDLFAASVEFLALQHLTRESPAEAFSLLAPTLVITMPTNADVFMTLRLSDPSWVQFQFAFSDGSAATYLHGSLIPVVGATAFFWVR